MTAYVETFSSPAARAAAGGLLSHHQGGSPGDSDLYARISARPQFTAILRAADPALVDPAVDPDEVFDMVLGAVLTRILLLNVALSHRPVERSVEMVLRLLRPSQEAG